MNQIRSISMKFAMAVVSLALASSSAFAQKTVNVWLGSTDVALSSTFLGALKSLDVAPGVIFPTDLIGTTVNFPIGSGAIDLDTAKANLDHQGGLTLTAGKTTVAIQDFIIDTTGSAPVITGLAVVNGALVGRITLFDLTLPKGFSTPIHLVANTFLKLSGITVTLDASAASTLNSIFGVTAFKAGLSIGTASVAALTGAE
jgi:hypothetical protein